MRVLGRSIMISVAVSMLIAARPATASSEASWAEFDQRVTQSCLAASGFKSARASGIVGFDDRVGKVAVLVSDRTRGSKRAKLCLYDKASGTAFVDEADGWSAPAARR